MKSILIALALIASTSMVAAANFNEVHFNKEVCAVMGGADNARLPVAGTKLQPDCLDSKFAYEADWGYKAYKEGIGQAITYAVLSNKEPHVIIYIRVEDPKHQKSDERGLAIYEALGISCSPKVSTDDNPWDRLHCSSEAFLEHTVVYTNRDTGEWWFK